MRKIAVWIAVIVSALCVVGSEVQQVLADCKCACRAQSGAPSSVSVDDTGACDRDFEYTFKIHYATNDDDCGAGSSDPLGVSTQVYANGGGSVNMQNHSITPTSFTIVGAGMTQLFTVSGQLANEDADGTSKTTVIDEDFLCIQDTTVTILKDPDCQ